MKSRLTVIVPCKNEERNIRHCIESFQDIADEILIADSGSTDATMDIAARYDRVRIIEREYIYSGDFKNWAIPQARHEWVLIVDADERVTPELSAEILQVLQSRERQDGYWIYRNNHFMGYPLKYGDARTDKVLRLFKRDLGRYEGPSDHGEIHIETGRVGFLKQKFDHYSHWTYDQYLHKFDRYTTVQAAQWQEQGRDTTAFQLLFRPAFRFFREWIVQGSILDGKVGIQTAWLAAMYTFMKQARLWELNHAIEPSDPNQPYQPGTTESQVQERETTRKTRAA